MKANWDRYVRLEELLKRAESLCAPDEYDYRLRLLTVGIAKFLLEPYHRMKEDEKER